MKFQKQTTGRVKPWLAVGISSVLCSIVGWRSASAATDLELYGRVVVGVSYQSNIAQSDGSATSKLRGAGNRWGTGVFGLRGTTDLRGGLQTLFVLETGFSSNDGMLNAQRTRLFNRRAYLGLNSRAGAFKIGKEQFLNNDVYFLDPTAQEAIGSANLVRGRNGLDVNNVLEYTTPTWNGLTAKMQTSLGDQEFGAVNKARRDGISLLYQYANFDFRTIYDTVRDSNGHYSHLFTASREWILGTTATFGSLKLFAVYENLQAAEVPIGAPDRAHYYWIGANYRLTPALNLVGAAYRVTVSPSGGTANLFMLGANYYLSKRTVLYAAVGLVRNGGNADFSVECIRTGPLPGQSQSGAYVGFAHDF